MKTILILVAGMMIGVWLADSHPDYADYLRYITSFVTEKASEVGVASR
jgi:hypothetical protein